MPGFLVRLFLLQPCPSEMQYAYGQPITDSRIPIAVFSLNLALAHRLQGAFVLGVIPSDRICGSTACE